MKSTCPTCGEQFTWRKPSRPQECCSRSCAVRKPDRPKSGPKPRSRPVSVCGWRGKEFQHRTRPKTGTYCSRECAGRSKRTTGGLQFVDGRWYVRLRDGQSKQLYSRCVMEGSLGRHLESYEHVHHINGDKADDRVENLEVLHYSENHAIHAARGDYGRKPFKLTTEQIAEIITSNETGSALARRYGVSDGLIYYHRRKSILRAQGRA
jgi:hypothetical protein